jgi:hypothetical protein
MQVPYSMNTKKLLLLTLLALNFVSPLHTMERLQTTIHTTNNLAGNLEIIAIHLLQDPDLQISLTKIKNEAILDNQTPSDIFFIKYRAMAETPEYLQYRVAEINHREDNTDDSLYMLNFCKSELNNTREYKEWLLSIQDVRNENPTKLQVKTISHSNEMYSDNVINKHHVMEQTPEWIQYQEAKQYHKMHNTSDTQNIVDASLAELHNTKECQEWLHAMDQEQHVMENIMKSEHWNNTQQTPYNFASTSEKEINSKIKFAQETKKRREDTFDAIKRTPQFQYYLFVEAQYEKNKSPINLLKLKQCKHLLNTMPESLEYCKAKADERLLLAIHRGYVGPIIVEQNYPSCWVNYIEQEKMMHKLNLDVLPIHTKKPHAICILK